MTLDNKDPNLNMDLVLASCLDFKSEKTALQALFEDRGHILVMSPKCHPELAGLGIEYAWGKSKLEFRRKINDQIPANLHRNILLSLSPDVLPLSRMRKFARRTRDYRHVYFNPDLLRTKESEDKFDLTEKMRKTRKTHRNIVDLEMKYLMNIK
eukprot:Pompholyxophrys_punicea_v1_NODE_723_length_1393_cov_18.770553.p2 type:complete len:154 gc:universal NODE_723_length_1393_cov_18.770553:853-1314(+)